MAQNIIRFLALCFVSSSVYYGTKDGLGPVKTEVKQEAQIVQPVLPVIQPVAPVLSPSECVCAFMDGSVGVVEATGKNDGKQVEKYLRSTGLGKGNPWCAAFVRFGLDSCKVKSTITAWSPTAHNKSNVVWQKSWKKDPFRGKDVFTLWYTKLKRIGHTGFYSSMPNSVTVETVEGNTNGGGSRDGDGVYKRKRALNSLFSITRWE